MQRASRRLTIKPDLLKTIFETSLTGRGARLLTSRSVESLINYTSDKPYILARVEAKRIEPQWDRDMAEYSIYGMLPSSGKGSATDKENMISLFRELDEEAQAKETFAMRYDVWFASLDN